MRGGRKPYTAPSLPPGLYYEDDEEVYERSTRGGSRPMSMASQRHYAPSNYPSQPSTRPSSTSSTTSSIWSSVSQRGLGRGRGGYAPRGAGVSAFDRLAVSGTETTNTPSSTRPPSVQSSKKSSTGNIKPYNFFEDQPEDDNVITMYDPSKEREKKIHKTKTASRYNADNVEYYDGPMPLDYEPHGLVEDAADSILFSPNRAASATQARRPASASASQPQPRRLVGAEPMSQAARQEQAFAKYNQRYATPSASSEASSYRTARESVVAPRRLQADDPYGVPRQRAVPMGMYVRPATSATDRYQTPAGGRGGGYGMREGYGSSSGRDSYGSGRSSAFGRIIPQSGPPEPAYPPRYRGGSRYEANATPASQYTTASSSSRYTSASERSQRYPNIRYHDTPHLDDEEDYGSDSTLKTSSEDEQSNDDTDDERELTDEEERERHTLQTIHDILLEGLTTVADLFFAMKRKYAADMRVGGKPMPIQSQSDLATFLSLRQHMFRYSNGTVSNRGWGYRVALVKIARAVEQSEEGLRRTEFGILLQKHYKKPNPMLSCWDDSWFYDYDDRRGIQLFLADHNMNFCEQKGLITCYEEAETIPSLWTTRCHPPQVRRGQIVVDRSRTFNFIGDIISSSEKYAKATVKFGWFSSTMIWISKSRPQNDDASEGDRVLPLGRKVECCTALMLGGDFHFAALQARLHFERDPGDAIWRVKSNTALLLGGAIPVAVRQRESLYSEEERNRIQTVVDTEKQLQAQFDDVLERHGGGVTGEQLMEAFSSHPTLSDGDVLKEFIMRRPHLYRITAENVIVKVDDTQIKAGLAFLRFLAKCDSVFGIPFDEVNKRIKHGEAGMHLQDLSVDAERKDIIARMKDALSPVFVGNIEFLKIGGSFYEAEDLFIPSFYADINQALTGRG